jgi:hypothetical protein
MTTPKAILISVAIYVAIFSILMIPPIVKQSRRNQINEKCRREMADSLLYKHGFYDGMKAVLSEIAENPSNKNIHVTIELSNILNVLHAHSESK